MEILWFKGLAVLIIVMTAIVGGVVSIRIGGSARAERLLPLGDAFAGNVAFPVVLFVCGCGFMAFLAAFV